MGDGTVMTDEEAKAVQEAAKALQEVTRTARDIGRNAAPFVARVFGPLVENAVGILSGKLAYYRLENFFDLAEKTELLLAKRGVSDPRSVPVPFALPLIEAATMEGNDRMRDRWAALLATAMNPDRPPPNRSYVAILREFEPKDAALLDSIYDMKFGEVESDELTISNAGILGTIGAYATSLNLPDEECELVLYNLSRVECIIFDGFVSNGSHS